MAVESLNPAPPKIQASHFIEPKASKSTVSFAVKTFTGVANKGIWVAGLVFHSFLILPSSVRKVQSEHIHTHTPPPHNVGSLGICIKSPFGKQAVAKESRARLVLWRFLILPIPFFFLKGDYIYLEADKFSQAGQSFRLVSPSFCAPVTICVEFTYYMYGLGKDTKLKLLLGSPAGSSLTSLWQRIGSQSPGWLYASITIPSGHQQPMQVTDRGSGPFEYLCGAW